MENLQGFDAVIDQVIRRQQYQKAHPGVTIKCNDDPPYEWSATWVAGRVHCTLLDSTLGGLLDELDNLELSTEEDEQ